MTASSEPRVSTGSASSATAPHPEASTAVAARSARASLARGGALGFLGAVTSAVLGLVLTVVVSRTLGAAGAGVVMQAMGIFGLTVALGKFGLDSTALYLLPRLRLDDPGALRAATRTMLLLAGAVSILLAGVVQVLVPVVWADRAPETVASIRAALCFVPVGALMLVATGALRALGSLSHYVLVANVTLPALRPAGVAVAAVATGSVLAVTVAWAAPLVVALGMALVLLRRPLARLEAAAPADAPRTEAAAVNRSIVRFALPRTASAALEQGLQWTDVLLVGALLGNAAAGVYAGATRFVQAGMVVDAALRVVVSPRFSALVHRGDEGALRETYTTATTWLVLFASPVYVLLAVFAPVVLGLLGPEFVAGAPLLAVLAIGCTVTFLAGAVHTLLLMSGRSGWAAVNKAIVLALNVAANLVLLPRLGLLGAAIAWAACMTLDAALATVQVRHFLHLRFDLRGPLAALVLVLLTTAIPALLARHLLGPTALATVVGCCLAVLLFFPGAWLARRRLHLDGLLSLTRRRVG